VSLSKAIRFEILKRDKFTCQYCGRKAPKVLLHVDHVKPVADGGTNDIFNLVSSCADCNLGKGAVPLHKQAILDAQRSSMEDLEDRRAQLEMMHEWQKELADLKTKAAAIAMLAWNNADFPPLGEDGQKQLANITRRFGVDEVLAGIEKLQLPPEGTKDALTTIRRLSSLIVCLRLPQSEQDARYVAGIANNRGFSMKSGLPEQIREATEAGFTRDQLKTIALTARSTTDLGQKLYNLIEDRKEVLRCQNLKSTPTPSKQS